MNVMMEAIKVALVASVSTALEKYLLADQPPIETPNSQPTVVSKQSNTKIELMASFSQLYELTIVAIDLAS